MKIIGVHVRDLNWKIFANWPPKMKTKLWQSSLTLHMFISFPEGYAYFCNDKTSIKKGNTFLNIYAASIVYTFHKYNPVNMTYVKGFHLIEPWNFLKLKLTFWWILKLKIKINTCITASFLMSTIYICHFVSYKQIRVGFLAWLSRSSGIISTRFGD